MINICKYCFDKGYTRQQYKQFKQNIQQRATQVYNDTKNTNGMYMPVYNILQDIDTTINTFVIQELKKIRYGI